MDHEFGEYSERDVVRVVYSDFHSLTSETRATLSDKLTQAEAVFNIGERRR